MPPARVTGSQASNSGSSGVTVGKSMSAGQFEETEGAEAEDGAQHGRPRGRLVGRRRWLVAGGVVAAFTAMVPPPPHPDGLVAAGQVNDEGSRSPGVHWTIPRLSAGAP